MVWQVMTKEVVEIVSKMEENMSIPMRTLQKLSGSNFYNVISKGDFGEARK